MPIAVDMQACPNLAVPMVLMQHVVNIESAGNPFAIGVVGAHLERQPLNLQEAIATAHMLEDRGYNFSLGVAQINRYNLAKFGLSSYELAFDVCANLSAGSLILSQCYALAGHEWGKAFSCYYSGNLSKGFEDGYVQKIYDSLNRPTASNPAGPAPAELSQAKPLLGALDAGQRINTAGSDAPHALAMMRSSTVDSFGKTLVSSSPQGNADAATTLTSRPGTDSDTFEIPLPMPTSLNKGATTNVYVPVVTNPHVGLPLKEQKQANKPVVNRADLRLGARDEAFVF